MQIHVRLAYLFFIHPVVRGYWQIKVAEQDREKTAYSTPDGHFSLKECLLANALATFQQAMNMIDNGIHNGK